MFNERDRGVRRCTTHALYQSKLWQPAPSKYKSGRFNAWGHSSMHQTTLWSWWSGRPHHATSHLRSWLESQHQSVPGCAEECGDPLVQSGSLWQTLGVAARTRRRPASPKRPRLGFRRSATTLYPSLTGSPPPLTWTRWTTSFGHTSRTSPTWPPTTPKPSWSPPFAELLLALVEKVCSQFRIHIEAVIEAECGYIE